MTLLDRMRSNLGSTRAVVIKDEAPINPLQRRIAAKLRHIEEIKADRFYNRKDDASWIAGIRKEIRTLKEELSRKAKATI
jgi:hypothetical protein